MTNLLNLNPFIRFLLTMVLLLCLQPKNLHAQNCSISAGVDQSLCEQTMATLNGNISGQYDPGTVSWSQVSGPPSTIANSSDLGTDVDNLLPGNSYSFRLAVDCQYGGMIFDTVNIVVFSQPIANAGSNFSWCVSSGPANLNAALPPGYTGQWTSSNSVIQFADSNDPSTFISTTTACPFPSIVNLTWTISNGVCSASDQITVTLGIDASQTTYLASNATGQIICGSSFLTRIYCAHHANSTITITPSALNPASANAVTSPAAQNSIHVIVNNITTPGYYEFNVSLLSDVCGTVFNGTISFTIDNLSSPDASFSTSIGLSFGQGGPQYYRFCTDPPLDDTIWLNANVPSPAGATSIWSVSSGWPYAIDDPSADSTFMVFTSGGFNENQIYKIYRQVIFASGCSSTEEFGALFYNEPDPINFPDTVICNTSTVEMGINEGVWPIHSTGGSYPAFVAFSSSGSISQISGPAVSVSRIYANNSNLNDDYFRFSGLTQGNVYTFVYSIGSSSFAFPYNNCYSGPLSDTFTITYAAPLGIASGTDQFIACDSTSTYLTASSGLGQTGSWSFVSGPTQPSISDPSNPNTFVNGFTVDGDYLFYWVVSNGCEIKTDSSTVHVVSGGNPAVTVMDLPNCVGDQIDLTASAIGSPPGSGDLYYSWDIGGSDVEGQTITGITATQNSYTVTVIDSSIGCSSNATLNLTCILPVEWGDFSANLCKEGTILNWETYSERDNDFFILEKSQDLLSWKELGKVSGVHNSMSLQNYSFIDKDLKVNTITYYRLNQTDFNGEKSMHPKIQSVMTKTHESSTHKIFPNPARNFFNVWVDPNIGSVTSLELLTLNGKVVQIDNKYLHEQNMYNVTFIDDDCPKGFYLVRIKLVNGKVITDRVLLY